MESCSTRVSIAGEDLLRAFYKLFYSRFCDSSDQWKKDLQFNRHFYMKIILTIIPTDLVTNSLLSFFCPFLKPKKEIKLSASWWSGNEKYFCYLLRAFYKLFYSQFCDSSDQWKKVLQFNRHFYMKIILTIILADLVTN